MRFFLDANVPHALKEIFAVHGEVILARDHAMLSASDKDIASFATSREAILVTRDTEFSNPTLFPVGSHYGLLIIRVPHFLKAHQIANVVQKALRRSDTKKFISCITVLEPGRMRRLRRWDSEMHAKD